MEGIDWVYLVSRWLHLSAAFAVVGGAAYARIAAWPMFRTLDEASGESVREELRRRWAPVVHAGIAVLLLTGGFNFVHVAWPPKVDPMPYHAIFGVKLLAALAIFWIATAVVGRSAAFASMRRSAGKWLSVLLVLGGVVVLVSGILNQVRTHQKPSGPAQAESELVSEEGATSTG
ncbi:MAG: hypothetical protein J5J06_07935 [Phycisphaerae bacterium]|nr:hypothetical protein [Phycisphaerae bacterium]